MDKNWKLLFHISSIALGGTGAFFQFMVSFAGVRGYRRIFSVYGFICWCEGVPAHFFSLWFHLLV